MQRLLLILFCLTALLSVKPALAMTIVPQAVTEVGSSKGFPQRIVVKFSNESSCVIPISAAECPDCPTFCSSTSGTSFFKAAGDVEICLSGGAIINGTLYCPSGDSHITSDASAPISLRAVRVGESGVSEEVSLLQYNISDASFENVTSLKLKGNAVFASAAKAYFMIAALYHTDDKVSYALLKSFDGLSWFKLSKIPLAVRYDDVFLSLTGPRRITVSSGIPGAYHVVSSGYLGKYWGKVKQLNSSSYPSAVITEHSIIDYGSQNGTLQTITISSLDGKLQDRHNLVDLHNVVATQQLAHHDTAGGRAKTSDFFAFLESFSPMSLTAFYNVPSKDGSSSFYALKMLVNETEEITAAEEEERKREERVRAAQKAKEKAKREAQEARRKRAMEKKEKRVLEKKQFDEGDTIYMEEAKKNFLLDEEMIVVRDVKLDTVTFEKETFFW